MPTERKDDHEGDTRYRDHGPPLVRRPTPDPPLRGVVFETWNGDSGDVLVWFPSRGGPDEPGRAVQPILAHEVETAHPLTACPPGWVADAHHALRSVGTLPDLPAQARHAFGTALRHHTQPTP